MLLLACRHADGDCAGAGDARCNFRVWLLHEMVAMAILPLMDMMRMRCMMIIVRRGLLIGRKLSRLRYVAKLLMIYMLLVLQNR